MRKRAKGRLIRYGNYCIVQDLNTFLHRSHPIVLYPYVCDREPCGSR